MKTEMDAKRTALETWAKENGIDSQYLRYVFGGHHGHGGPGGMRGGDDSTTDTSAGSTTTTN
jgi:hypothetical protein